MFARFHAWATAIRQWLRGLPVLYRRLVQATAVLAAVAVVFSIVRPFLPNHDPYCANNGATVVKHAGTECAGVSDGSFVFDPALAGVEQDILAENQRVTAQDAGRYVSIVYLLPISSSPGSIEAMPDVVEQLRAAYIAQYRANRVPVNGIVPAIQLLVGNAGYQADQWQAAVDVIGATRARTHLAAVAGLGVSLAATVAAARSLTSQGVPVIGATVTANDFDNIPKFIRIAPSNNDAIAAAVDYIGQPFKNGLLVEDENPDDSYDATLVAGFLHFADASHALTGKETFDSTPRTVGPEANRDAADKMIMNRISQMPPGICAVQPAAVLFAGRGRDLAELVSALADRPCLTTPITVISGADVTNLPFTDAVKKGLDSGVTVDYAGLANPGEWAAKDISSGSQGFTDFTDYFLKKYPNASLTDGNSMAAYDATLTAISAIRLTSDPQPSLDAVAGELGALHKPGAEVLGASGPLDFYADYDTSKTGSDPERKPIPILRLTASGESTFLTLGKVPGQEGAR